jgi:hypothetical protein
VSIVCCGPPSGDFDGCVNMTIGCIYDFLLNPKEKIATKGNEQNKTLDARWPHLEEDEQSRRPSFFIAFRWPVEPTHSR